jgi:hypothetical protein
MLQTQKHQYPAILGYFCDPAIDYRIAMMQMHNARAGLAGHPRRFRGIPT